MKPAARDAGPPLAAVFTAAREDALAASQQGRVVEPEAIRHLDPRARVALGLLVHRDRIVAHEVASALGLSDRMARVLLRQWVDDGWLAVADASRRARTYELSASYRQFIGNSSAMRGES